jgi:hypothetical protein
MYIHSKYKLFFIPYIFVLPVTVHNSIVWNLFRASSRCNARNTCRLLHNFLKLSFFCLLLNFTGFDVRFQKSAWNLFRFNVYILTHL